MDTANEQRCVCLEWSGTKCLPPAVAPCTALKILGRYARRWSPHWWFSWRLQPPVSPGLTLGRPLCRGHLPMTDNDGTNPPPSHEPTPLLPSTPRHQLFRCRPTIVHGRWWSPPVTSSDSVEFLWGRLAACLQRANGHCAHRKRRASRPPHASREGCTHHYWRRPTGWDWAGQGAESPPVGQPFDLAKQ
jgi:hypothetical protein